jgi:hypothetical protein
MLQRSAKTGSLFFQYLVRRVLLNAGARLSVADEKKATIQSSSGQGITLGFQMEDIQSMLVFIKEQCIPVSPLKRALGCQGVLYS